MWQAHFTTVFPIEHSRRARTSARERISTLKMSSGDHFRSSCASFCCARRLPFHLSGRQSSVLYISHHYGILHPVSKITHNLSGAFPPFISPPRMRLSMIAAIYVFLPVVSRLKFRPCVYNGESYNGNGKASKFTVAGEKISLIDVFVIYDTIIRNTLLLRYLLTFVHMPLRCHKGQAR